MTSHQAQVDPTVLAFASEVNLALEKQIWMMKDAQARCLAEALRIKATERARLLEERSALLAGDHAFNVQYVRQAETLRIIQAKNAEFGRGVVAASSSSPRSNTNLVRLDDLERRVSALESECFALVPLISQVETKTALAILKGKTEEIQAKHVDAIESLGLTNQPTIMTRRRTLVKRLDIICNLAKTLHGIAGKKD